VNLQSLDGIRFGNYLLDRGAGGLFRSDEHGETVPVALGSGALDVLAERPGRRRPDHGGPCPDRSANRWGRSIPGAVGLMFADLGGSLVDAAQSRLQAKLGAPAAGDVARPIAAVGWDLEHFDALPLAPSAIRGSIGTAAGARPGK
jgi:hypothetical protein